MFFTNILLVLGHILHIQTLRHSHGNIFKKTQIFQVNSL